ncbi:MAG: hypothetical protein ABR526_12685 [Chthoniobacterales bacterium]
MARTGVFISFVAANAACKPAVTTQKASSAPSSQQGAKQAEEDIRIGRNVMPLSEVMAELSSGTKSATVLEHVRQRHIATLCVDGDELRFAANGASRDLLAALKDRKNLLTPAQETAYMQMVVERQADGARAKRAPVTAGR